MVGLIPPFAVETIEPELLDRLPRFKRRMEWFLNERPDLAACQLSHHRVAAKVPALLQRLTAVNQTRRPAIV